MTHTPDSEWMLLPYPHRIERLAGVCRLAPHSAFHANGALATALDEREAIAAIRRALDSVPMLPGEGSAAVAKIALLACAPGELSNAHEGYRLEIASELITLTAASPRGRFYAAQTLVQLIRQFGALLPCLKIDDGPDLPIRGAMFDVSRGKVPTLATLLNLVEMLAGLKYNQLQLYIEHTFAFARHPLISAGHSPITPDEIRTLDAHCRRFHVDLVPNLQSFGHVAHTLEHSQYAMLAESDFRGGWTLSPVVPATYELLADLYDEYLPCFSHRPFFNVDCDETWDLAKGRSAQLAAELGGKEWVYLQHLQRVHALAAEHGRRACFWADMAEESAGIFPQIPKDMVALHWWYESEDESAHRDYIERTRPSMREGLEHWVCPGTSSWLSFFFRKDNARGNLRRWALTARESGAVGYLNTDWGDFGHHNCLSYSYWPLAYGADCAWRAEPDHAAEACFDQRFFLHVLPGAPEHWRALHDAAGALYQPLMCNAPGVPNTIARLLLTHDYHQDASGQWKVHFIDAVEYPLPPVENLAITLEQTESIATALEADAGRYHGELDLVRREWLVGMQLQRAACCRALGTLHDPRAGDYSAWQNSLLKAIKLLGEVWMERNRSSDWEVNRTRLEVIAQRPW